MSRPCQRKQIAEIKRCGYVRGELGGSKCDDCQKPCGRGWYIKVSYEYDEVAAVVPAYDDIHKYDGIEYDESGKLVCTKGTPP